MYSTFNEEKSVIAERFIRTLKRKIHKCMTTVSKNVYIDKLDDIINKYNNTHHITIRMKPFDVKSSAYFVFIEDNCYHKELHLGCCSSPRSVSDVKWKGYNNLVNSRIDKKDIA